MGFKCPHSEGLIHMGNSKYAPDIQKAAYPEGKKKMLT